MVVGPEVDTASREAEQGMADRDNKEDSRTGQPYWGPSADIACLGPSADSPASDKASADSSQAAAFAELPAQVAEAAEVVEVEAAVQRPAWELGRPASTCRQRRTLSECRLEHKGLPSATLIPDHTAHIKTRSDRRRLTATPLPKSTIASPYCPATAIQQDSLGAP